MPHQIDLRPILANPAAAEMLLLARGQLNRAFRTHGLVPPDPLVLSDASGIDAADSDDPAARGIESAMAEFQEDFILWASFMPAKLVPPVLDILRQAHEALVQPHDDADAAGIAVRKAYEFLLGCLQPDQDVLDGS
jgi:hypothetical protein